MRTLLSLALLFVGIHAHAGDARWDALVSKMVSEGTRYEVDNGQELRALSRITPDDKSVPHQAEYISTIGYVGSSGEYAPMWISAVSETWRIDEAGDWRIDQWLFSVTLDGQLRSQSHILVHERIDGTYIGSENQPVEAPEDPVAIQRWQAKQNQWYLRRARISGKN